MKKRITKIIAIICSVVLFGSSLTCFAAGQSQFTTETSPHSSQSQTTEVNETDDYSQFAPDEVPPHDDLLPPLSPNILPPPADPGTDSNWQPSQPTFLEYWHSLVPDNSRPTDYGIDCESWNAYSLAYKLGSPYSINLFGYHPSSILLRLDEDEDLLLAETLEKQALLGRDIELTTWLNDLILVPASGGRFPRTKSNGQLFTGTMVIMPYNSVTHHLVISEEYTIKPGDTLGQIILDCGWMPEGRSLYGADGYLNQYAAEQKFDLSQTLIPGDVIRWHSEDIQVIDNLDPKIELDLIPGQLFSGGASTTFEDEKALELLNSLPILSDFLSFY